VLLENPESIFYKLCMNTGKTQFEVLAVKARAHSGAHYVEKEYEEEVYRRKIGLDLVTHFNVCP
jgi:hypothetical protein